MANVLFQVIPCAICITVIIAAGLGIYFSGSYLFSNDSSFFQVVINSKKVLFKTDEKFLSVALDSSFMRCFFHKLNDGDWDKLEKLSKLLSPAYFRLGGTDADRTLFRVKSTYWSLKNKSCDDFDSEGDVIISGDDWLKLNKFAQNSNLSLIFDFNVLLRKKSRWDYRNAETLLRFSESHDLQLDFQLGNEPNFFRKNFNITITGNQLADDFYQLRKLLNSTNKYSRSKIIGPDVTKPHLETPSLTFLEDFLSEGDTVDAVSWHQYYLNGRNADLDDFINPDTFKILLPQIKSILSVVRMHFPYKPVWISETSSAYGGGAPGLSDRFAASFLWVDKLGVAARSNISVVIRQSLLKGNYALIGDELSPNPDFWISVLYKHLVGSKVLDVVVRAGPKSNMLRFYSHCIASNSSVKGNVVLYGINISKHTELFVPSWISIVYPIKSFIFTPKYNDLRSRELLLNDNELRSSTTLEEMLKMAKDVKYPLNFPSFSVGFWVFKETRDTACKR